MTLHPALAALDVVTLAGALALQPQPASAAAPCAHVIQSGPVTDPRVKATVKGLLMRYLGTVNPDMVKGLAASEIDVSHSFQQGEWAVYRVADPAVGLDAGFVFVNRSAAPDRQPYVWGGSATPDERADIVADIRKNKDIGADLAACVADTIVGRAQ